MSPRTALLLPLVLGLAATPALALAGGSGGMADVAVAAEALAPNRYVWNDASTVAPVAAAPVAIVVSIPDQRAYVYRGTALVAASTVSTGRDGNETPVGAFTILQKEEVHHSNLYDDAAMPYMQRLTWDGVALHAGKNPGFPDSHGCIRLPAAFAKKLFAATKLGGTVVVTDEVIDPASYGEAIPSTVADDAAATAKANRVASDIATNFDQ
ncbi:conserved exported hypothetical protein [Sphingomonas sp. EC-HK361]|uniref:L,D-transpeptidase family protein n=1 Tax=Sphingomonas sp. EC-HK361 TaxID=2038397 RepID=UPI00125960FF|nr:L,D-transpeptidase family protein [Sphingomonas sp. EC-HK361]VVT06811.1 conserved exported hypothetical protein [Sphingomonas sp. EC-HK361]